MFNEPSRKVLERIPRLRTNEETPPEEIVIHAHFFVASCDWWAAEFDGKDTFWGFVNLGDPQNAEWGPFLLSELWDLRFQIPVHDGYTKAILGHLPVQVEWDEHWEPKPFGEIRWEA